MQAKRTQVNKVGGGLTYYVKWNGIEYEIGSGHDVACIIPWGLWNAMVEYCSLASRHTTIKPVEFHDIAIELLLSYVVPRQTGQHYLFPIALIPG